MPTRRTVEKARADLRAGKSPTTAAGEFVHEEIEHIRAGKHGATSTKQAIAIGLSKARRAGVSRAHRLDAAGRQRCARSSGDRGRAHRAPRCRGRPVAPRIAANETSRAAQARSTHALKAS